MRIKRTEARLFGSGMYEHFDTHREDWRKLNKGEVVEVSKQVFDEIEVKHPGCVQVASTVVEEKSIEKIVEEIDKEGGK